jgi:predicted aminopeptidase
VSGHLALMRAARPVDDWLADPATPPELGERLRLAQAMRRFASERLALPDNNSYRRYADLGRPAVVWNAVAAPEFGFTLKTWCYPLMGCAGYRGYFDQKAAQAEVAQLAAAGWDAQAVPVPAYSTLGWSGLLGGDPLLNTFIRYPEGELAALIFHELAHQRVYVNDDTGFNEAYASAVEGLGARAWLAGRPQALAEFERGRARRAAFLSLARATREQLAALYARELPEAEKRAAKAALLRAVIPAPGYERWFANANNASFALLAAYDDLVPGFERLFEREGRDWSRFHAAVQALAALTPGERRARLRVDQP